MNNVIIDSNDSNAVLVAWVGEWDMGGWPNGDEDAFKAAIVEELRAVAGAGADVDESGIDITYACE